MFPEKHTIFVVVSTPSLLGLNTLSEFSAKIEGYYTHEHQAEGEVKRLSTWKACAIVKQEVDINDLVRMLSFTNNLAKALENSTITP